MCQEREEILPVTRHDLDVSSLYTTALSSSFVLQRTNLRFIACTISGLLQYMSALAVHTQLG
jgi:hypothetical protein